MNQNPIRDKKTAIEKNPQSKKRTGQTSEINHVPFKKIAWNFSKMDCDGPYPCTFKKLSRFRSELLGYEGKTIQEILSMRHCHPIGVAEASPKAKKRLQELNIDYDIMQLDIGTPKRLWGILEHNIFHLMWIDLFHDVYQLGKNPKT